MLISLFNAFVQVHITAGNVLELAWTCKKFEKWFWCFTCSQHLCAVSQFTAGSPPSWCAQEINESSKPSASYVEIIWIEWNDCCIHDVKPVKASLIVWNTDFCKTTLIRRPVFPVPVGAHCCIWGPKLTDQSDDSHKENNKSSVNVSQCICWGLNNSDGVTTKDVITSKFIFEIVDVEVKDFSFSKISSEKNILTDRISYLFQKIQEESQFSFNKMKDKAWTAHQSLIMGISMYFPFRSIIKNCIELTFNLCLSKNFNLFGIYGEYFNSADFFRKIFALTRTNKNRNMWSRHYF